MWDKRKVRMGKLEKRQSKIHLELHVPSCCFHLLLRYLLFYPVVCDIKLNSVSTIKKTTTTQSLKNDEIVLEIIITRNQDLYQIHHCAELLMVVRLYAICYKVCFLLIFFSFHFLSFLWTVTFSKIFLVQMYCIMTLISFCPSVAEILNCLLHNLVTADHT